MALVVANEKLYKLSEHKNLAHQFVFMMKSLWFRYSEYMVHNFAFMLKVALDQELETYKEAT